MKLSKYVVKIQIGEKHIIHNSNKDKDVREWVDLSADKSKKIDSIEVYERDGISYKMTYRASNRKIGF